MTNNLTKNTVTVGPWAGATHAVKGKQREWSEKQKNAPAGESRNRRQKRSKDKMIRLDDLIPRDDVAGGRHSLFGAIQTQP